MKILHITLLLLSAPLVFSQNVAGTVLHGSMALGDLTMWGDAAIPQGDYTLTVEYAHVPVKVTVRSVHGKTNVFFPVTILAGVESGRDRICLTLRKSYWQVRSIDLPDLGISLLFMSRNQLTDERRKCVPISIDRRGGI